MLGSSFSESRDPVFSAGLIAFSYRPEPSLLSKLSCFDADAHSIRFFTGELPR